MLGLDQIKLLVDIVEGIMEVAEKNPEIADSPWFDKLEDALEFLKKLEEGFGFLNIFK